MMELLESLGIVDVRNHIASAIAIFGGFLYLIGIILNQWIRRLKNQVGKDTTLMPEWQYEESLRQRCRERSQ